MSSVHVDNGSLVVSFYVRIGSRSVRGRLYPGLKDDREGQRSPLLKQVQRMIAERRWEELAERYPECTALASFRKPVEDEPVTFRQVSERFLAYQGGANEAATVEYYRSLFAANIWRSPLADKEIKLVAPSDVIAVIGALRREGHIARANKVRQAISAVFNWAKTEHDLDGSYLVDANPVARTKPLKNNRPKYVIDPLAENEIPRAVQAARDGWERRMLITAVGTGQRPGELFGMKRADVDFAARVIHVRQSVTRFGEKGLKTASSLRDIDMSDRVYAALRQQVEEVQLQSEWLWPDLYHHRVRPHSAHNFSRRNWPEILRRAGLKHRAFGQCRHTFAVALLRDGAPWEYLKDQMGHETMAMLMKHYLKWRPGTVAKPNIHRKVI